MKRNHRTGLTLGKFAPLHKGHQFVIESALEQVDELYLVAYDSPEATHVPLQIRVGWVQKLYPSVNVIQAWNAPQEVGYTPEIMQAHEDYLLELLSGIQVTHFFSSEPYGNHVSKAFNAIDCRVDSERKNIPISATQIRNNPFAFKEFLDPIVYRDHIINAVFLGAPSSGKTTLSQHLANEFQTQWMPEYGREYWDAHQCERQLDQAQLLEIAEGHLEREDRLLEVANRFLFTDTNALTTLQFAEYYHGVGSPELVSLTQAAIGRYDLVFLCDIDIPYDDTWDRSGEVNRLIFQQKIVSDLKARKIPYILLRGSVEQRADHVKNILSTFQKYTNLLNAKGIFPS